MKPFDCTCPEDWQGMDHTSGCKARAARKDRERAAFDDEGASGYEPVGLHRLSRDPLR